ncbi:sigma factor-like helix-turn-helix DNA-binding protein [Bacillus amyloliquefaciens]|uniref:sigma factor-like helix-turn-helix DNA-binding protein n=1 Tax=Bacillus amyloliquefaciens TaxID=1390 RepID=UPI000C859FD0|nr:sigma factor-like helix-turn-helix DNA-binding protein [Bacillus amyloliquefaciens]
MDRKAIENLINSYHWMAKEIHRLQKVLYGSVIPMKNWGVAKYGLEAAMPKGSPGKSQAELRQMDIREDRLLRRLMYYEERVYAVELGAEKIKGEQHKVIYDCMMEGMSYRAIGLHLGISRETVRKMKDELISQLCQDCHFERLLNLKKTVV